MALTKYTYSITNDFPNQVVDITKLIVEIEDSAITTDLSHINTNDDICDIYFVDSLSVGDESILDGLVSVHDGVYSPPECCVITISDTPEDDAKIWLDSSSSVVYYKDNNRDDKWLSINKHAFEYARKGSAKGMYLPLLGDLDAVDDTFMSGRTATMVSLSCKSRAGDKNAEFEIRKNGVMLYEFAYDGSDNRRHINNNLNFDIELDDEVQVYVKNLGSSVNNTYCKIEISWRYEV